MPRRRMYVFERAYVDYAARLRAFFVRLWNFCRSIWGWFWEGAGANVIEHVLRVAIVLTAIALDVFYVRYEYAQGRSFGFTTFLICLGILLFSFFIMWGWKAPVHFLARAVSGGTASGSILTTSSLAAVLAVVVFTGYLLGLVLITLASLFVFLPMRAAHYLWLFYRHIAYRCPYDDDGGSHGLPIHVCTCGESYDDLQPSFYGIFNHICRHDDGTEVKLPTMDFLGRKKLHRLCAGCKRPLVGSSLGELAEMPISLVGGPSVGKTVFLTQAVHQLQGRLNQIPGSKFEIDSEAKAIELRKNTDMLGRGQLVAKTVGDVMQATSIAVRIPKIMSSLLYIYDSPGEHFLAVERFGKKQILQHTSGIILLVDPFSLPSLAHQVNHADIQLRPSATPFKKIVDVIITGVNLMLLDSPVDRSTVPVAVVIAKADALPTAAFPFLEGIKPNGARPADMSARCRNALVQLGGEPGVRALEQKFTSVRYFSCSALGRMPNPGDASAFQPAGVIEPLQWVFGSRFPRVADLFV